MLKTETVKIANEEKFGRDVDKIFRLKEMSAMAKEKWSAKLYGLTMKASAKIPTEKLLEIEKTKNEISATLAIGLLNDNAPTEMSEYLELQNEHLYCYEIFDNIKEQYVKITPENIDNYIEEVETLQFLRNKAIEFNMSFMKGNR